MIAFDMPPQAPPARINPTCIIVTSAWFNLPPEAMLVIRMTEGGAEGTVSRNPNNTFDHGPNQINTINLPKFERFGYTKKAITHDECTNTAAAGYLLREHLVNRRGDIWQAMMDYHSKTPEKRARYLGLLTSRWQRLQSRYGAYCGWLRNQTARYRAQVPPEIIRQTPELRQTQQGAR